ncbi:MFS transporter [Carnobacterium maltaromaticum]|uniref:MFS transporter n=1 Tax=Carnobacterium maltaromaticum TaxID=2751 RepID=UPI000C758A1F|nr:MFS transporter [Carnobacterium maltaromaticum]PLS34747.1 MFS transporter [Carnobacterium maltaromaticum]PLS36566.1 MFS transporter [Carnobacterium maltaromaticum]PLS37381.1 MFS transporter [Carnobacterium maltaromaticum]PLS43597.1 MFS transporter [Carnobacterium maltaromaticum]PLS43941.1 MFS transporter [Carnobacterium maltaromaticum]
MNKKKITSLLLASSGISSIGEWIYFIALNLIVLNRGATPAAVGVLYILRPLATVLTTSIMSHFLDDLKKRKWLIILDITRACMIVSLVIINELWWIYLIVFLIQGAVSIHSPLVITYTVSLIPAEKRKKYNALSSLVHSGGFLLGPAIAGLLLMVGTPKLAIVVNSTALFLSAYFIFLLPNCETVPREKKPNTGITFSETWFEVKSFSLKYGNETLIYSSFLLLMSFAAGLDSIEVSFAKGMLDLTDGEYGLLVSIAGLGILCGSGIVTIFSEKLSVPHLLQSGSFFFVLGYFIYAISTHFISAAVGFFLLSFALAFANTGFYTFRQNYLPFSKMGLLISFYDLVEALLSIFIVGVVSLLSIYVHLRKVSLMVVFCMWLVLVFFYKKVDNDKVAKKLVGKR